MMSEHDKLSEKQEALQLYYKDILHEAFLKEKAAFSVVRELEEQFNVKQGDGEIKFPGKERFQKNVHSLADLYVMNQLIHLFGLSPWQDQILERVINQQFGPPVVEKKE
jgi:hypothetical protein